MEPKQEPRRGGEARRRRSPRARRAARDELEISSFRLGNAPFVQRWATPWATIHNKVSRLAPVGVRFDRVLPKGPCSVRAQLGRKVSASWRLIEWRGVGVSRRRRRWRSHRLLGATIVVAIVAVLWGAADLGYVALKGRTDQLQASLSMDLQAGQSELEAGKASLTQANSKHD